MSRRKKKDKGHEPAGHKPARGDASQKPKGGELVTRQDLDEVRLKESDQPAVPAGRGKKGNVFIGTLNVIVSPLREILDPVKKVCYEPLQELYDRRYRQKFPKHHSKVLILDAILLSIAGALAVFGIFIRFLLPLFPQPQIVYLQPAAPTSLVSGELSDFSVSWRNDSDKSLAGASLQIVLPDGFVPTDDNAEDTALTETVTGVNGEFIRKFDLGTLPPNGTGQVTVSGRLYAPTGSRQTLAAIAHFWQAGQTEAGRVISNRSWLVENSLFRLYLRPEDDIVRGRQVSITIPYANLDERSVNAKIQLRPPDDFVITGSQPARTMGNEWSLGQLEPQATGNIVVYGYFRASSARPAVPAFSVEAWVSDGNEYRLIEAAKQTIEALSGGFKLEQTLTEPSAGGAVNPGDTVELKISYQNAGQEALKDIKITLKVDEKMLAGQPRLEWDSDVEPDLAELAPGSQGTIKVSLPLAMDLTGLSAAEPPVLNLQAVAEYYLEDQPARPVLAETAQAELPFSTELTLKTATLYWTKDGDQLGSGPLPPRVGATTKYRVVVQVNSTINRTDNTVFEAYLPPGVEWTGQYSVTVGQPPAFVAATRRLIWNIGSLPAKTAAPDSGASFEVAVTPTASSGALSELMRDLTLCGLDSQTEIKVCDQVESVPAEPKYRP